MYGLLKYAKPSEYIMQLPVLAYTKEDALLAAELEFDSEKKGKNLARTDAIIAAIVINNNAKLYTNHEKHFTGIKGLSLF